MSPNTLFIPAVNVVEQHTLIATSSALALEEALHKRVAAGGGEGVPEGHRGGLLHAPTNYVLQRNEVLEEHKKAIKGERGSSRKSSFRGSSPSRSRSPSPSPTKSASGVDAVSAAAAAAPSAAPTAAAAAAAAAPAPAPVAMADLEA